MFLTTFLTLGTIVGGIACNKTDTNTTDTNTTDTTAPVISDIYVSNITKSTATISWTTDELATSNYECGPGGITERSFYTPVYKTSHSVNLSDLSSGTTYLFRVISEDASGNEAISDEQTFTTTTPDITTPTISGVTIANVTETTVTISWTTNESATSNMDYGLTSSYDSSFPSTVDTTADKTSHSLNLSGLSSGTTYHFQVVSEDASGNEAISDDQTFTTTPSSDVTVDEQVVFSQEGITITVKSLDLEGSFFGPELKVLIENQNAQDITVQAWKVAINDVMVDSMFSCDVVSGKAANDGITFFASCLETAGIETIKDIEFEFDIFSSDSWNTIVHSDTIEIRTSVDDSFVQEYDDSGSIALDENGIKVVIKGLDTQDSIWGPSVLVYVENNTGQDVTIQVRDVSVNGFMIDPMFSCDILDGKKAFDSITFLESDLTDNGITTITTIELSFNIFNPDTWETIFNSDVITISF